MRPTVDINSDDVLIGCDECEWGYLSPDLGAAIDAFASHILSNHAEIVGLLSDYGTMCNAADDHLADQLEELATNQGWLWACRSRWRNPAYDVWCGECGLHRSVCDADLIDEGV